MKQVAGGTLGLTLAIAMVSTLAGAPGQSMPSIKEIMDRLHKGCNSPVVMLKKELQADEPRWDEVQRTTREFVVLGGALPQNKPPRGDRQSWVRFAQQYLDNARAMDEAAQKKDRQGALAARDRLAGSCMACHRAHSAT